MAHQQFVVSDTNPNDTHGGGGCVCDPVKQTDCKPPYVIVTDTFMEDPRSPHTVICQSCADAFSAACKGEVLSVGEKNPFLPADYVVDADDVVEDDPEAIPEV